jgi:hypothetical protein
MTDRNAEVKARAAALERIRSLDWPTVASITDAYVGETRPRKRYNYGAVWCYGHFANQGGAVAIGHLDATAHRAAIETIKETHPDYRNRLPEPMLSAFQLDLLQTNVSVEQAKSLAKKYGARLEICQGNNPRSDSAARLYLALSAKGLGLHRQSLVFASPRHRIGDVVMGIFAEIVRRLGMSDSQARAAQTRYIRSNWDELASHIVRRRGDGTSFDEPYTGGQLPDSGDLWPTHLGTELRQGNYGMTGEVRQDRDGSWHRGDGQGRRDSYQHLGTQVGDFGGSLDMGGDE